MNTADWCVLSGFDPRYQALLESALRGSLIGAYDPQVERVVSNRYKEYTRPEPLFPGYIFARGSFERILETLRSIADVRLHRVRNVGFVSEEELNLIREREDSRGYVQLGKKQRRHTHGFEKGDQVRIIDGSFAGYLGKIERLLESDSAEERIFILLENASMRIGLELPVLGVEAVA